MVTLKLTSLLIEMFKLFPDLSTSLYWSIQLLFVLKSLLHARSNPANTDAEGVIESVNNKFVLVYPAIVCPYIFVAYTVKPC